MNIKFYLQEKLRAAHRDRHTSNMATTKNKTGSSYGNYFPFMCACLSSLFNSACLVFPALLLLDEGDSLKPVKCLY